MDALMNMKSILVLLACLCCSVLSYDIYEDYWTKLNKKPVCFEGKNSTPGIFQSRYRGFLAAVMLDHRSGHITCDVHRSISHYSNWGCHKYRPFINTPLSVFITDERNQILFPKVGAKFSHHRHWYSISGFDSISNYLVLQAGFNNPFYVGPKSRLKLWYGEDLMKKYESDNKGRVCADVYGYFV